MGTPPKDDEHSQNEGLDSPTALLLGPLL